jgi:hypothetical protein
MRDQFRLETEEGARPATSGGERILVVLAALVLVAAGVIVAGKLAPEDETAVIPSGSPRPTARPQPTPSPTPAPVDLVVEPAQPSVMEPEPQGFSGFIRAKEDLTIRSEPDDAASIVGTLAAGDAASVWEDPSMAGDQGWLSVSLADADGWVATRRAGRDLVVRYPYAGYSSSGYISRLAAGDGFVGVASLPGTYQYGPSSILIESADGASWRLASKPPGPALAPVAVAWGPVGWVAISSASRSPGGNGRVWLASSADRSTWDSLGALPEAEGLDPMDLVASEAGYLLSTQPTGRGAGQQWRLWRSTDALHWHEVRPGLTAPYFMMAATQVGFLAWTDPLCCTFEAAFSPDGLTWSAVSGGPEGLNLHVAALGDRLLAVETVRATGEPRTWIGTIRRGEVTWARGPTPLAPAGDAVVTALVSAGGEVTAFGWDRLTEEKLQWTTDGSAWRSEQMPAAFEGFPTLAAQGSTIVAIGHRLSIIGDDPLIWHRAPGGVLQAEANPVIPRLAPPAAADCPPPPTDVLAWMTLNSPVEISCRGGAPLTFRAWSLPCAGCTGDPNAALAPAWLANPTDNSLFLAPIASDRSGYQGAILDPSLGDAPRPEWIGAWLQVTGHYDDPAAADCRWTPNNDELAYYAGSEWQVNGCRMQFVVTAVKVVDGP